MNLDWWGLSFEGRHGHDYDEFGADVQCVLWWGYCYLHNDDVMNEHHECRIVSSMWGPDVRRGQYRGFDLW